MNINYNIFDPKIEKPLHQLSRKEARAAYNWFLLEKENRLLILKNHARNLGVEINNNEKSIPILHEMLIKEIKKEVPTDTPSPYLFSLCNDIGIFISELLIKNSNSLKWSMHTARKSDLSYQRPVISGFNVKNKNYSVDIDYVLCQYMYRIIKGGKQEESLLIRMYQSSLEKT